MKNKKTIIVGLGVLALILAPVGIYSLSTWSSDHGDKIKQNMESSDFKGDLSFDFEGFGNLSEETIEAE